MATQKPVSLPPWQNPVPVKKSNFVSLHGSGKQFNLETDLGKIGSFREGTRYLPDQEILLSDVQTNVYNNSVHRMGSGRSGVYAGKYLKGIGRTTLAANWNDHRDGYHNTGHMFPSAAIREYLATVYLRAKGASDSIVNCEGFLLRKLPKDLAKVTETVFGLDAQAKKKYHAKVDFHLQAITYKEGNFARASNLNWFLSHMGSFCGNRVEFSFPAFLHWLGYYLDPVNMSEKKLAALDPDKLVDTFDSMIHRTVGYFRSQFQAGIFWSSFNNNYTLDGRFVDLEVPLFLGVPLIGNYANDPAQAKDGYTVFSRLGGIEAIRVMEDLKIFIRVIINRLELLLAERAFQQPVEEEYCRAFLAAFKRRFITRKHWIFERSEQVNSILQTWKKAFDPDAKQLKQLKRLLEYEVDTFRSYTRPSYQEMKLIKAPVSLALSEPHHERELYIIDFLYPQVAERFEEIQFINEIVRNLETLVDVDELLEAVHTAERKIIRYYRK